MIKFKARSGKQSIWLPALVLLLLGLHACSSDPGLPNMNPQNELAFEVPPHFPPPRYQMAHNEPNKNGFELGRTLFYDPILSIDSSVSCADCHAQVHAFADHNIRVSVGVNGQLGSRNAPALSNLAWYPSFMWDGGINHLEVMPLGPISEPHEMNENIVHVMRKLKTSVRYQHLFERAFGPNAITDRNMLLAMAQFMSMMISADSKYDRVLQGKAKFSAEEARGYALFQQHCADCHQEPLLSDFSFRNNGLDSEFKDPGRMRITGNPDDEGLFKVPTLRNIDLTYPYMHDGRFRNLEEVLNHYVNGVVHTDRTDPLLKGGISLTADDRQALLSFLHALNDHTFLSDLKFSEPKWNP